MNSIMYVNKNFLCEGCGRKRSGDAAVEPGTLATQEQITEIARHVLGQDRMLEQLQQKVRARSVGVKTK
jgi:hypothetical protein